MKFRFIVPALLAVAAFSLPAFADAPPLQTQTQGNVTYISGGLGDEQQGALHGIAGNFNLHLVFAENSGAYLADIRVKLVNSAGQTVLDVISTGPYFYAKLEPGKYQLTATSKTNDITKSFDVPAQGAASDTLHWPDQASHN